MNTFKVFGRSLWQAIVANPLARASLVGLAGAGLLPEWIWRWLSVEREFRVSLPGAAGFSYAAMAYDSIGQALFWRGWRGFEPETTYLFYKLAQKSNLVLDIGANTGVFALLACAANPSSRVIAFEPLPQAYRRLQANLKINGWEDRCQARPEAVSNTIGLAKFHVPFADLPSSASLHAQGFRNHPGYLIDVQVTTIDVVCPQDERVDLVKIDVEGFEDKVLEGMQRILSIGSPALIIECVPDGPCREVNAFLVGLGYRFFHLRPEGLVAMDRIVPDSQEQYRNFLCIASSADLADLNLEGMVFDFSSG